MYLSLNTRFLKKSCYDIRIPKIKLSKKSMILLNSRLYIYVIMTFFITEFTKFIKRNNLLDFVIVIKFDLIHP